MEPMKLEVHVTIAVSESGMVECCIADTHWIQKQQKHAQFMADIRADKQLWTCKTIRVNVPMPVQFEDMRDEPPNGTVEPKGD